MNSEITELLCVVLVCGFISGMVVTMSIVLDGIVAAQYIEDKNNGDE